MKKRVFFVKIEKQEEKTKKMDLRVDRERMLEVN